MDIEQKAELEIEQNCRVGGRTEGSVRYRAKGEVGDICLNRRQNWI